MGRSFLSSVRRRRRKSQAGFTLVEILVVITIIGLIMALVGPRVLGYLGESKAKAAKIQIESFSSALDLYYLDLGRYPASNEGLAALTRGNNAPGWTEADVEAILKAMLLAIDRAKNPGAADRFVALRGFSWIVEPAQGGVVIAIEIPSGAAVAGPFAIEQARLDRLIARVLAAARPSSPVVH